MADIELVIKIPEDIRVAIGQMGLLRIPNEMIRVVDKAIQHGTPLPKGHGDLIDRNDLLKHYDNTTYHNGIEERKIHFVQIGYVNDAPTIIEADKAKSEGER